MATSCISNTPADEAQPGSPKQGGGLLRQTFVYGAASLFAYGISMVKAVLVVRLFGTTPEMDAYALAILLPKLIGALVSSTTAGALVPALAKASEEGEEARATVFRSSLAIFTAVSLLVLLLIALFASPLAHLVGAAFDPYRLTLTARMLRWASVLVVLTGVYAVCSAELLARKRYWAVGLSPALGTAISLAMIWSASKPTINVLAWSLVAGAAVQAVILVVPAWNASRGGSARLWSNCGRACAVRSFSPRCLLLPLLWRCLRLDAKQSTWSSSTAALTPIPREQCFPRGPRTASAWFRRPWG